MRHFCNLTFSKVVLFICMSVFAISTSAQNVTVAGALSGNGSYPDLNSAFAAINGGAQTNANISVNIVSNTTETVSAVLSAGAWTSLSISPSGGNYTITGALASALIDLDGANNVVINGLNTGGNSLTVSNTNTGNVSTATLRLINGAANNTITNCTILGASTSATLGTILFSTSSTTGNSFNLISNCNISAAGIDSPVNGIYSAGTATFDNTDNTILNCNVSDFFSAAIATRGILISGNNSGWTISGNRFYQSGIITYTTANTHGGIQITSGNNYLVNNNLIGYASAAGTGMYSMTGTVASLFVGINLTVGTATVSTVQGNTLSAISLTTSSGAATTSGVLCGINITAGNVNVVSNIIGGTSGTDLIVGNPSTTGGLVVGLHTASTGTINITANYIGGLTSLGTSPTIGSAVTGIINSAAVTNLSVSGNTIGNVTPGNMRAGALGITTAATNCSGIHVSTTPAAGMPVLFSGNMIRNFTSNGNAAAGTARGIFIAPTSGSCSYTVTNNTITGLVNNNPNPSQSNGQIGTSGIVMCSGTGNYVANNTIHNIANTSTAAVAINVAGISTALQASLPMIVSNKIYDLRNAGTGTVVTAPPLVTGVFIRSATSSTVTIANNMISLGNGQSGDVAFVGICGNFDSNPNLTRIYFNTINIEGVASGGTHPTFGFLRGNFAAAKTGLVDIRNNLITNSRSGGTGVHSALANSYGFVASSTGWAASASDNNVLNTANSSEVGWWNGALTFAAWKTTTSCDLASYSGIAVNYVNSANDLHLNMGTTPTLIESNAQVITGFTTDIDNQNRPGPSGSVNGGGLLPDIGADEFDGAILDVSPPVITYVALTNTCGSSDRTLTATIFDLGGIPVTGSLQPRLYYNKNAGTFISSQGVLTSGNGNNGIWSFVISATALSGLSVNDVVSYFVVAQDEVSPPHIISNPAVGFVGSDVNSVSSAPSSPNSYTISTILTGTYTVGSGGNYTTLSDAATAYNNSCLGGAVTFLLTDALYGPQETFPIVFMNNPDASASFSLLVRPAANQSAVISGTNTSAAAAIKFLNARYISFDGINSGGSSLMIINPNTGTSANIWLASTATSGPGNMAISLKNMTLIGGSNTATGSYGILAGVDGASPALTGGINNDNITIEFNTILRAFRGITAVGTASVSSGGLDGWKIAGNLLGPAVSGTGNIGASGVFISGAVSPTVAANTIRNLFTSATSNIGGIHMAQLSGGIIIQNTITGVFSSGSSSGVNSINGIIAGLSVNNSTIGLNTISGVENTSTGGWGARGLIVNTGLTASNLYIQNNMISDISSYSDAAAAYWPIGIAIEGTTGGLDVDFNSVNLFGSHTGLTSATGAAALYINSTGGNVSLRNNILVNTYDNNSSATEISYAIYSNVAAGNFATVNYNNYFVGGAASSLVLGYLGGGQSNLTAIQTAFGGNMNSINAQPVFISNNDLHLQPVSGNVPIDNQGISISGITTDIDGQTRSVTTPDIGADEFTIPVCTTANGGIISIASGSACAGQTLAVTSGGVSSGINTVYQWQYSTVSGGPYINVTGGSGDNTPSYTSAPLPTGVYYVVLRTTCTSATLTAISNEATLTVNAIPSATAAVSVPSLCSGSSFSLNGSSNIGTTYAWSGPSGYTSTSQNPVIANAQAGATGSYSLVASEAGCASSVAIVNVTVTATPGALTVTPASTLLCAGNSSSLMVDGGNIPTVFNFTPQVNMNSATTYPAPYSVYYGGQKMQILVLASELTNAGLSAGPLTAIQFPVVSLGSNWGNSMNDLQNFQVSVGATGLNSLAGTFQTGLTVVASSVNYTPVTGYGNIHIFNTPFPWDGISNVIVETVFSNNLSGTTNDGVIQYNSPTTFQSTMVYRADSQPFSTIAAATTTNVATTLVRPDFKLHGSGSAAFQWTPSSGLSSTTGATVNATPLSNTIYTVTADNSGCTSTKDVTVNVNPNATISIVSTGTAVCLGNSATLTATGATSYTWDTQAFTSSIVVTPSLNTVYTASTEVFPCPVVSESYTLSVNPLPVLAPVATPTAICAGETATLTVSGAATYSWSTGSVINSTTVNPLANTNYTVTGIDALGCESSSTITMVSNPLPVVTVSQSASSVCVMSPVTFTASGAATYSWNTGSTNAAMSATPAVSSVYTVTGTLPTGCAAASTVAVNTFALPLVVIAPATASICENESAELIASGALSYVWQPGNLTTGSVTVNPAVTTVYTVTGTNANNCVNTATVNLVVDPCTGIKTTNELSTQIRVFPNPSTGVLNAVFDFEGVKQLIVTNSVGALMMEINTESSSERIDLSGYAKGIYFIRIGTGQTSANFKIIIQ